MGEHTNLKFLNLKCKFDQRRVSTREYTKKYVIPRRQTKVQMIVARYSLSSIYYSKCNQFGLSADLTSAYISNSVSGGQLDSLTHWEAWYETNLHLLHSTIDIDTIWNIPPFWIQYKRLESLEDEYMNN